MLHGLTFLTTLVVICDLSIMVNAVVDQNADGKCVRYTINHVYGSEGPVTASHLIANQTAYKGEAGSPGKAGPRGPSGTAGEKGERGETGPQGAPCDCDEVDQLKEQIAVLASVNDFPKSCQEVAGARTGYYLISPKPDLVQPFYVYCNFSGTNQESCITTTNRCNCDQNSSPETSDEGFLTDKTKLPVSAMWFEDAGDPSEKGWHSLGRLECSGLTSYFVTEPRSSTPM